MVCGRNWKDVHPSSLTFGEEGDRDRNFKVVPGLEVMSSLMVSMVASCNGLTLVKSVSLFWYILL